MTIKKDLIEIYNHFGQKNQRTHLVSECYEYIRAVQETNNNLSWCLRGRDIDKENAVIDETADLFILAYQHYLTDHRVRDRVNFKIERTKERIKSGYYDEL